MVWKIFKWLYDYFSLDERKQIAELKLLLKQRTEEISKLKSELQNLKQRYISDKSNWEVKRDKLLQQIQELNLQIEQINKENKYYQNIIQYIDLEKVKLQQDVYSTLNKKYKRVLLEYNKRWVLDKRSKKVKMMANDFVKPSSWLAYKFEDKSLRDIWKYHITYISDNYQYNGCLDVWQLPIETYTLGKGDCDDSTAFRVATAKSLGLEKDFLLFMAVGFYITSSKKKIGHAFPVLITKDGEWYILEATSNIYDLRPYPNEHYEIHYLWDENYTWKIRDITFGGKVLKEFDLRER